MELYDTMIRRIYELLGIYGHSAGVPERKDLLHSGSRPIRRFSFQPGKAWTENEEYECIFQKDTGVLLGGNGTAGYNILCVTTDPELVPADETILAGPDLSDLRQRTGHGPGGTLRSVLQKGAAAKENVPYVRITLILAKEIGEEKVYRTLQEMDFVKYNIYPKGYMVRASGQSSAEQVRVSKKALQAGISFEQIGNAYIKAYKKNPKVEKAAVLFLTAPDLNYTELRELSLRAEKIRKSLSVIMKGIATDCKSCSIKEVCSEIEGLREAHFRTNHTEDTENTARDT